MAGGYNDHKHDVVSSVEIMSPLGTNWRMMTSLPSPRYGLTLVTIGDKVRLLGGGLGFRRFPPNELELSELSDKATWNVIPGGSIKREFHTALVITC